MSMFRFGEFEADEERFELRRSGRAVRVQRRVLEAIFYLLRSRGHVVTKRDLIRGPWHGVQVSDAAVSRAIMLARRAIADPAASVITTVHGQGYRFVIEVSAAEVVDRAAVAAPLEAASAVAAGQDAIEGLRAAFADARQRRGSIVVVSGANGAGETSLVERFARELDDQGALVAWGMAWAATEAPLLWPWREIVEACAMADGDAGAQDTAAVALEIAQSLTDLDRSEVHAASVRRWDGEGDADLADQGSDRSSDKILRIFGAVARLLTQLAHRRPLVAVIEDIEHADDSSALLVEFLRQRIWRTALLVVVTRGAPAAGDARPLRLDDSAPHVRRLRLLAPTSGARADGEDP